jgi:hypothetical protein
MNFKALGFVLLSFFLATSVSAGEYCAAIRGNGENVAAHWPALARMVEENGMPSAMAGGSSASISMFFLNGIAGNPAVKKERNSEKRRKKEALLIKSLGEFVSEMGRTEQAVSAFALLNELAKSDSDLATKLERAARGAGGLPAEEMARITQKYFPLLSPEIVQGLAAKPRFFKNELKQSVAVFGKFDAVNDKNLFVRPGLVDFREFAVQLGQIADFYSGNTDEETQQALETFTNDCAEGAFRKHWEGVADSCKKRFREIVSSYLRKGEFQNKALFEPIGANIKSIPTTALVKGEAVKRFQDLRKGYFNGERQDYSRFSVDFDTELSFGYWTDEGEKIRQGLKPQADAGDLKSQKFEPMKPGNWFEVLATSPAEPGLTSIQPIPVNTSREQVLAEREKPVAQRWQGLEYRRDALSAGGWSDLHPTGVLKASGCKRVAYFTRQDGETVFGQQVFIRLTGAQKKVPFWERIRDENDKGWQVAGSPAERSPWNRLYNNGNPASSFNRAVGAADITYCTNWNRFQTFQGQKAEMEKDAYEAPVFLKPGTPRSFQVNRPGRPDPSLFPGCIPVRAPAGAGATPAASGGATSAQ